MSDPKPASTLVIMKDRSDREFFDILMLLRSAASSFVPLAYVFPGGGMDESDSDNEILNRCYTGENHELMIQGVPGGISRSIAYRVTAIRETFEEAGILFACDETGSDITIDNDSDREKYLSYQHEINRGKMSFNEMVFREGLFLPVDRLVYLSHWVTPAFSSIRYDTRFFAALCPPGHNVSLDGQEIIDHQWLTPDEALQQNALGKLNILIPTMSTIELVRGYASSEDVIRSF